MYPFETHLHMKFVIRKPVSSFWLEKVYICLVMKFRDCCMIPVTSHNSRKSIRETRILSRKEKFGAE